MKNFFCVAAIIFFCLHIQATAWSKEPGVGAIMLSNFWVSRVKELQCDYTLIINSPAGKIITLKARNYAKLNNSRGDYLRLITVISPKELKGHETLILENQAGNDIWVYEPATRKRHKLSQKEKTLSWLGSDFSYSDLVSFKLDDYQYSLTGSEKDENIDCYVVEMLPKTPAVMERTGYSRKTALIRKDIFIEMRTDCQAFNSNVVKTLTYHDVRAADPLKRHWLPFKIGMINHAANSSSEIEVNNLNLNPGLSDDIFKPKKLGTRP